MAKAANRTVATGASVKDFISGIKDPGQRDDARRLVGVMSRATKTKPKMWGASIVGFGSYRYKYASGREGDWCVTGFSPRKGMTTIYILPGLHLQQDNLEKLGKFTTGKSCIYIKRLSDVDLRTLERMAAQAMKDIRKFTSLVGD
jgi:hypothetical protein